MAMTVAYIAICLLVGYLFGNISTAYIVGKRNNIDIREFGSKNAGTTNAMRTLGKKAGIIVFLGDCIKAVVAILIMMLAFKSTDMDVETIKLATGFGAVLGHNFPFWLGFKGGKGIAVTSSVILVFCLPQYWICPAICLLLFALIVKTTRYVSLGSLVVVTTFLLYIAIVFRTDPNYVRILVLTLMFVLLAFYMHRANIVRLLKGTENKIGSKKANDEGQEQQSINNVNNMNAQGMNNQRMNPQGMNNQRMNPQGINQGMNNQNMNPNMVNQQGLNNQRYNQNQMFLDPSDLVDTNISDFNNLNNNKFGANDKTEQLYDTQYFDVINNNLGENNTNINSNNANMQKGIQNGNNNSYYKAYDSCDTLDETRQLDDEELYGEANDMLNTTKSYYDKN